MRQRSLIEEYLKGIRRLERAVKRINQIKTPEAIIKNVLKECNNILKSSSCALVLEKGRFSMHLQQILQLPWRGQAYIRRQSCSQ